MPGSPFNANYDEGEYANVPGEGHAQESQGDEDEEQEINPDEGMTWLVGEDEPVLLSVEPEVTVEIVGGGPQPGTSREQPQNPGTRPDIPRDQPASEPAVGVPVTRSPCRRSPVRSSSEATTQSAPRYALRARRPVYYGK